MQSKSLLPDYDPAPEPPVQGEQEPRVITADVAAVLRVIVRPDDEDSGSSVTLIAEKAKTSTRTVYRVLSETTHTINLDLADRLCLAADAHLSDCRLLMADGTIIDYYHGDTDVIIGL